MDAIITYVDGQDPKWQSAYRKYVPVSDKPKRFRDWGTLRYLLRGIETNMPFIDNVYLVVACESQVPTWVDRSQLHVVLHDEIMPPEILPVFNSCTIEMFLHRIPTLSEQFIYFNDDMFPLAPSRPTDFFSDGKPVIGISHHLLTGNMYKRQCRISDRLSRKALGMRKSVLYIRPQHICSPMLKSQCDEVNRRLQPEIHSTASRIRTPDNPNQYLFLDYMYHKRLLVPRRLSNKHISQGIWKAEKIADYIMHPQTAFACINDVEMPDDRFYHMQKCIIDAFEMKFPNKSSFEL